MYSNAVYIIGAGHSGSTLFDVLLAMHPDICGTGEVHRLSLNPQTRLCGCGSAIQDCLYWSEIIDKYISTKSEKSGIKKYQDWSTEFPLSLERQKYGKKSLFAAKFLDLAAVIGSTKLVELLSRLSKWAGEYKNIIYNSLDMFSVISAVTNSHYTVDSTKTPLRGKMLYLLSGKQVKFIHVIRDGRGVTASMIRREGVEMDIAAKSWKRTINNVERVLKSVNSKDKFIVKYEDLCRSPETELVKVWKWLGIEGDAGELLSELSEIKKHQIPGNPVLYRGIEKIVLDEKWRLQLSERELQAFERIAGKLNRKYTD